jgi:hypothetical protein
MRAALPKLREWLPATPNTQPVAGNSAKAEVAAK